MMPSAQSRLKQAIDLLAAGRAAEAESSCRRILSQSPADPAALNLLGISLRHAGRFDEAETAMRRAIECSGGNPEFHANLAQLLRARGRFDASIEEFNRAIRQGPAFRPARIGLARTALQAGRPAVAEQQARHLIAQDAQDHEALSVLGSALYARDQPDEAIIALQRAVASGPQNAVARQNLAAILGARNRSEEALAAVQQCERLGLRDRKLELTRARALMQLDRYEESEAVVMRQLAGAPDDYDLQFLLAQLRHMRGDADFARTLRAAATRPGAPPGTRVQYANVLRQAGQPAAALAILQELIAVAGPLPQLVTSQATILQELGQFEAAAAAACAAFALRPEDPVVAENFVSCLLSAGDPEPARAVVERFRSYTPLDQRWITYRTDIARQCHEDLFDEWCDVLRLVRVYELEPPPGYRSIADFHEELRVLLEARHRHAAHPLDQSLRGGTQTSRGLLDDPHPMIRKYLAALAAPLADYQAAIGQEAHHPMRSRNTRPVRPTGCWSVRLKKGGYHVNHIHPRGWISSAYYVSVPAESADPGFQSGWLKFGEPRFPMPGAAPRRLVQPLPGRLVLFPSYFWHGTTPIAGDEPRLTIAFDCLPLAA